MSCEITIGERTIRVQFPQNMGEVARVGIEGGDYPPLRIPDFAPRVVVDVGANIGATALYFLKQYPGVEVHCFEPSAENFAFLAANTEGLAPVRRYPYGLADHAGEVCLYPGAEQCAQTSQFRTAYTRSDAQRAQVRPAAETLRELGLRQVDILKVDTEGAEVPIVRDLLAAGSGVSFDVLYLEYHSEEDRVRLDRLLTPDYWLAHARATKVHRGTLGYVHRRRFEQYPEWYDYRIVTE